MCSSNANHIKSIKTIKSIKSIKTYPEFCAFQKDGNYCDGPYVKHCIKNYQVLQYSCVSGCVSGRCIGASLYCYSHPKGWYCDGHHRKLCKSDNSIGGYSYCPHGCSIGQCIGPEFTECKGKDRGCECDTNGNINCCSVDILMKQIKCNGGCVNGTCSTISSISSDSITYIHTYNIGLVLVLVLGILSVQSKVG